MEGIYENEEGPYMILESGVVRDLRINSRWIKGCSDKMTDFYPLMLVEYGQVTYWNSVEFVACSAAHVRGDGLERTVRMRTQGAVICR